MITSLLAAAAIFNANSIYDFTMENIDGKPVALKEFKGKVLLVVNVASQCGNTPQYAALEALFEKYGRRGFAVLGFPANEFGAQEPGSNSDIKAFCTENYKVKFPMFSKIVVKGEQTHPLYRWLIEHSGKPDEISWNFEKFLVGKNGEVVARFSPKTKPDSPEVVAAIEKALGAKSTPARPPQ